MIETAVLLAWLGSPSEPGVTELLEALEARAVDLVQRETGRYFGTAVARTEYLQGDDSHVLRLRERPSAVTTVHYRTQVGDDWTAIAAADDDGWELRAPEDDTLPSMLLRKAGGVWSSCVEYKVAYSFGYIAGAEPGEIRQLVMDVVALKYNERGREGLRTESIGDYSYSIMADVMGRRDLLSVPGVADVLERWRGHYA